MTDVVEAGTEKRRGAPSGPRGPRTWKDKPTQREQVMGASLQEAIKAETGHDVDLEVIRAVRFTLPKWLKSDEFKSKKNNIAELLEQQKLKNKANKALQALAEVKAAGIDIEGLEGFDLDDDDDNNKNKGNKDNDNKTKHLDNNNSNNDAPKDNGDKHKHNNGKNRQ